MDSIPLPHLLREYRERQGISQRALAQAAGYSPSYIGKVEAGEVSPSLRAFMAIVRALGLSEKQTMLCLRLAVTHENVSASQ